MGLRRADALCVATGVAQSWVLGYRAAGEAVRWAAGRMAGRWLGCLCVSCASKFFAPHKEEGWYLF